MYNFILIAIKPKAENGGRRRGAGGGLRRT